MELPDASQEELQAALGNGERRLGSCSWPPGSEEHDSSQEEDSDVYEDCEEDAWLTCSEDEAGGGEALQERGASDAELQGPGLQPGRPIRNSSHLVSRDELLEILKALHTGKTVREGEVTVGLVSWDSCLGSFGHLPPQPETLNCCFLAYPGLGRTGGYTCLITQAGFWAGQGSVTCRGLLWQVCSGLE